MRRVKVKRIRKVRRRRVTDDSAGNETRIKVLEDHVSYTEEQAMISREEKVLLVHDEENSSYTSKVTESVLDEIEFQKALNFTSQTIVQRNEAVASEGILFQNISNRSQEAYKMKRVERKRSKLKTKTPNKNKAVGGGKSGECLRRIKREWKDAVKLGIAYDWTSMQTVTRHGRSASGKREGQHDFLEYNYVRLGPMGKNLLRWHFSVLGPSNSDYENGIYHGRVLLPKDYPGSPPRVQMLTPSGRFVTGEDICLSASAYHPETWTPRWTVLSLVDALRLHMLTSPNEIGGVDATKEIRRKLAIESRSWRLGGLNHRMMVQSGLFRQGDSHADVTASIDFIEESLETAKYNRRKDHGSGTSTQTGMKGAIEKTTIQRRGLIVYVMKGVLELLNPTRIGLLMIAIFFLRLNAK